MKRHDLVMKYEETIKLFVIKYGMQNVWIRIQQKVRFKKHMFGNKNKGYKRFPILL